MRRKYLGLAIAAITALGPASAFGGDREIAEEIMTQLKSSRDSGALKDFTLDMKVDQGVVLFRGSVSKSGQKQLVLEAAEGVEGIQKVVDEVIVTAATPAAKEAKPAAKVAEPAAKVAKPAAKVAEPQAVAAVFAKTGQSLRRMLLQGLSNDSKPTTVAELVKTPEAAQPVAAQPVAALPVAAKPVAAKPEAQREMIVAQEIVPGEIRTTAAVELAAPAGLNDQQVVAGVVKALGEAQQDGRLRGFGVDVKCSEGVISLKGRAGSAEQRDQIVSITQSAPGVRGVDQIINVIGQPAPAAESSVPAQLASNRMSPVNVEQVPAMASPQMMNRPAPVAQVATPMMAPQGMPPQGMAPQGMPPQGMPPQGMAPQGMATQGMPPQGMPPQRMGSPVMGAPMQAAPVAMNYGGGVGAPRYDAPNLPNYAWPGYAAHPNYAALTYPQQYSPSAWPYIGPFYPYPQVPLGWRKVSLEWDDGWWFLDFTDR